MGDFFGGIQLKGFEEVMFFFLGGGCVVMGRGETRETHDFHV